MRRMQVKQYLGTWKNVDQGGSSWPAKWQIDKILKDGHNYKVLIFDTDEEAVLETGFTFKRIWDCKTYPIPVYIADCDNWELVSLVVDDYSNEDCIEIKTIELGGIQWECAPGILKLSIYDMTPDEPYDVSNDLIYS